MDLGGHPLARPLQLLAPRRKPVRLNALGPADIAIADVLLDRIAPPRAGEPADLPPVAEDRSPPQQDDRRIGDGESDKALAERLAGLGNDSLAAEEGGVLPQLDRPAEARLQRRVVRADIGAPGAIALL